ncbi:YdcF family protein [Mesobacillus harenae]|uniref:YdcF family protein n=1 Tax=Mesobacillus harenae TaxID=2213203 RepID=UPI0015805D92|nr:YdcF family protein [Mesobacillus harenae]
MKKPVKKSFLLLLSIGIVIIFLNLGDYLVVNETPQKSDVIVVLSGEEDRLQKGAELYNNGYGDFLLLTNSTVKFSSTDEALALGIPRSRILEEEKATSTYTNAIYAKELIEQNNYRSAIIVSSDFHMRRTKLIFTRIFKDSDFQLLYVSSDTPWFNKDQWWGDKHSRRIVINEWIRIVGYQLYLYKWIDVEA